MLWGDETVSDFPRRRRKDKVSSSIGLGLGKTVIQAHDTVFLRIVNPFPGDQSVATARVALRKHLAERQGDSSSHGVGRKHG
jgi:hypothetical protein